ncbi:MAG: hypothetical protein KAI43_10610 [Candidatus Aureabacteria bacterium]|nr:hypothetical protein [Candidatus Auribacterota bacterium]
MNFKQKIVLWIGIAIIVGMGIFPPWKVERGKKSNMFNEVFNDDKYTPSLIISNGYHFLFNPPSRAKGIDVGRLFVQIGLVTIITGGLLLTIKKE